MHVAVTRYDGANHRTPEYLMTMYIYAKNTDKDYNNTYRTIYEEIDELFWRGLTVF